MLIGLRGAVAFALSLHMNLESRETRQIIVTTTLITVLFTILFLGGSTMPLMKVSVVTDVTYILIVDFKLCNLIVWALNSIEGCLVHCRSAN